MPFIEAHDPRPLQVATQVQDLSNATPPLLVEVMGRAIREQLFGHLYDSEPTLLISRQRCVPDPEETAPLPAKYQHLVKDHPPHPGPGKGPRPVMEGI
jgi:hypothetical protein